jgi:hypothetical protein
VINTPPTVALIHATLTAIAPVRGAFADLHPRAVG